MGKKFIIPSEEFWIDEKWAHQHYQELVRDYANKWVAILKKKVISTNEDLSEVEKDVRRQLGNKPVPLMYVEGGSHVYQNRTSLF